jgi:hypothetical protein
MYNTLYYAVCYHLETSRPSLEPSDSDCHVRVQYLQLLLSMEPICTWLIMTSSTSVFLCGLRWHILVLSAWASDSSQNRPAG